MNEQIRRVTELSDGLRSSREIARLTGLSDRYVRKLMAKRNLPRLPSGAQPGERNHQFVCGRRVDLDGYVYVTGPKDHPQVRRRPSGKMKPMLEHQLVLEKKLGRHLLPGEVTDHIDGLTLHNAPENLRVFASNAEHLRETLRGQIPKWSAEGRANFVGINGLRAKDRQPVDIYYQRRKHGEIRLRQILLAALSLGTESPFLLGTERHTKKAGIDMSSRPTIERALADLCAKWGADRDQ